jgi:hypothetical protein
VSARNRPAAKARRSGHPARNQYAAEVREFGLALMIAREDDVMMQHATAALWTAANGRLFTHRGNPLPGDMERGAPGKCFANAQRVAHDHGLRYAEGFAGPSLAGEWTLHAWNVDARGRVIDPTWGNEPGPRGRYLGVVFDELPEGDDAGISMLVDLLGGKLVSLNHKTGAVRLVDGDSAVADMVKAEGGSVFVVTGDPHTQRIERAFREAS